MESQVFQGFPWSQGTDKHTEGRYAPAAKVDSVLVVIALITGILSALMEITMSDTNDKAKMAKQRAVAMMQRVSGLPQSFADIPTLEARIRTVVGWVSQNEFALTNVLLNFAQRPDRSGGGDVRWLGSTFLLWRSKVISTEQVQQILSRGGLRSRTTGKPGVSAQELLGLWQELCKEFPEGTVDPKNSLEELIDLEALESPVPKPESEVQKGT